MEQVGLSLIKELELETEFKKEEYKLLNLLAEGEKAILKKYNVMVCGGAITSIFSGVPVNDIDCYFRSKDDCDNTFTELKLIGCKTKIRTANAVTLETTKGKDIQLISLEDYFQDSPEKVYEQFDFTMCMAAYDFSNNTFSFSNQFLKHLSQRVLVFNTKAHHPINTILRVNKFKERGFSISKTEYFKIILSLTRLKLDTYGDLVKQLNAVSSSTHFKLVDKINDKKLEFEPFDIDVFCEMLEESQSEHSVDMVETKDLPF